MRLTFLTFIIITANNAFALEKKFYKEFWEISPKSDFSKAILSSNNESDAFKNLVFMARTGFGIKKSDNTTDEFEKQSPYSKIVTVFNKCLNNADTGSTNCPDSVNLTLVNEVKSIKFYMSAIEQCFANIPADQTKKVSTKEKASSGGARGIQIGGVSRDQTKLERELSLECSVTKAKEIVDKIYSKNLITNSEFARSSDPDAGKIKNDFSGIYNILNQKMKSKIEELIIAINKSGKIDSNLSFIDATKIEEDQAREIFAAYNEISNIDSYIPPMTMVDRKYESNPSADKQKIMYNGKLIKITSIDPDKFKVDSTPKELAEKVAKKRNGNKKTLEKLLKSHNKLTNSYGILKQNALLNIANIVNERTVAKDQKMSQMEAIEKLVNLPFKTTEKEDDIKPSLLLKQIRDAINLNNKLTLMLYMTEERIQMALASLQIANLKGLADIISKNSLKISKVGFELDLGSEMEKSS